METYVEISGRGTGKTWRLKQEVNHWINTSWLDDTQLAVIYTPSHSQEEFVFEDKYNGGLDARVFINKEPDTEYLQKLNRYYTIRYFYNEFDHLDNVKIERGNYYVTSPRFLRDIKTFANEDDTLYKVLRLNNGKYVQYSQWCLYPGFIDHAREELSHEQYCLEILAQFYI